MHSCKCDNETFNSIKGWKYLIRWATIGFSSRTLWSSFGHLVDQSVYWLPTYLAVTISALSLFYNKMSFPKLHIFRKSITIHHSRTRKVEPSVAPTSHVSTSVMALKIVMYNVELTSKRKAFISSFVKIVQQVRLLERGEASRRQCNDLIRLSFF